MNLIQTDKNGPLIINLYGGPGTGKTTLAAELFVALKKMGIDVGLVNEYAQECVYEKRTNILKSDQSYIVVKQNRKIKRLYDHAKVIVTDSPLMMAGAYFDESEHGYDIDSFMGMIKNLSIGREELNFLLQRNDSYKFSTKGRTQNSANEANIKDDEITALLHRYTIDYQILPVNDIDKLFKIIMNIHESYPDIITDNDMYRYTLTHPIIHVRADQIDYQTYSEFVNYHTCNSEQKYRISIDDDVVQISCNSCLENIILPILKKH